MNSYVADTMAVVLRLEKRRMPKKTKNIFNEAENGHASVMIPSIVFAELAYLSEKTRIDTTLKSAKQFVDKYSNIHALPMTIFTVLNAFEIDDIPELHDRLIAASAREHNSKILTNDPIIQQSDFVNCIWK